MLCPECHEAGVENETDVLETRGDRRRRGCPIGHRFTTDEIPRGAQRKAQAASLRALGLTREELDRAVVVLQLVRDLLDQQEGPDTHPMPLLYGPG